MYITFDENSGDILEDLFEVDRIPDATDVGEDYVLRLEARTVDENGKVQLKFRLA